MGLIYSYRGNLPGPVTLPRSEADRKEADRT